MEEFAGFFYEFVEALDQSTPERRLTVGTIVGLFVIAILVIVSQRLLKPSAKMKGRMGEDIVKRHLTALNPALYRVLHDVMVPTQNGQTAQIDHIVVSRHGKIFVIETKNYTGWITGSEKDKYWRQTIYKKKSRFMNPLHQNFGHVQALKEILTDEPNFDYVPIVAFTRRANLKVTVDANTHVVYANDVARTIQNHVHVTIPIERVEEVANKIASHNITDAKVRHGHDTRVHTHKVQNEQAIANGLCPRCGGQLVERRGKYGSFKGCSNYPKCRFTMQ